jgi:hypothetical protein
MIGIPRTVWMIARLMPRSAALRLMPIIAQQIPSAMLVASAHRVKTIVMPSPRNSTGMNWIVSVETRSCCLFELPVSSDLGMRRGSSRSIARLIWGNRVSPLRMTRQSSSRAGARKPLTIRTARRGANPQLVTQYRRVAIAGVDPAVIEIPQEIGQVFVRGDIGHPGRVQLIDEAGADLPADPQRTRRRKIGIGAPIAVPHDQRAFIGIDRAAERHDLLTLRRAQQGRRDHVDLARDKRGDQRGKA